MIFSIRLDLSQLNVTVKQEPVDYLQTEEEPQLRMSPEDSLAMERKREELAMERKREELRKILPGIQVLGANLVKSEDSANKQELKIQGRYLHISYVMQRTVYFFVTYC